MKTARQQFEDKAVSLGRLTREEAEGATSAYLIDHIREVQLNEMQPVAVTHDFDRSGLGIGGTGRHDLAAETAELVARGEMTVRQPVQRRPMPNGQLWQECSCGEEPVCVDCEQCRNHCGC